MFYVNSKLNRKENTASFKAYKQRQNEHHDFQRQQQKRHRAYSGGLEGNLYYKSDFDEWDG